MLNTLPDGYLIRPATMADVPAALVVVTANDIMEYGEPDYNLDDLQGEFADVNLDVDSWVIEKPDGSLAGYALIFYPNEARMDGNIYVHPDERGKGFGTLLTRLVEERAKQVAAERGASVELTHHTPVVNQGSLDLLANEGYEVVRYFWRMGIDMTSEPAEPAWPNTITVRTFVPGQDDVATHAALEAAFQDHWGWSPSTLETFRKRIEKPDFDPTLWFLACEGEQVVATCLCNYFLDHAGWVRNLGVLRSHRKLGLGQALLQHAFAEFYRRDKKTVMLGVDAASLTGAIRLYERAGMQAVRNFARLNKMISA